jgi:hypothetical protein
MDYAAVAALLHRQAAATEDGEHRLISCEHIRLKP